MPSIALVPGQTAARGIGLQLAAVLLFSLMAVLVKLLGERYSIGEIVFFRSWPALIVLLLYLPREGGWPALRSRRPGVQAIRVAAGLAAMIIGFHALSQMAFADYVAITFAAPLFATLLSIPLLGETVGRRRLTAVLAGFVGVLLAAGPGADGFAPAALLALLAAGLYAVAMIAIRKLGACDRSSATVFYFTLGTLVAGLAMPGEWRWPAPADWAPLTAIGLLGGMAQILMTEAYRHAPTCVIAPFDYTAMVWALGFGFLVFGTVPAPMVLLGAAVICGAGLYILYRETLLGVRKPRIKRTSL